MENSPTRVDDLLRVGDDNDTAILYNNERYSYSRMRAGMHTVAANLVGMHIFSGTILVLLGNRPEAVMAMMGASYNGCTFVPLPSSISVKRLGEIIADSGAIAAISDSSFDHLFNEVYTEGTEFRALFDIDNLMLSEIITCKSKPVNPAALMYTSGTTGEPKGVICTHEKMLAAVSAINAYLLHRRDDVIATTLPLSHGYGLYQIFTVFAAGGTVLLEDNFSFPAITLERIKKYKATGFAAVPSMINMIMTIDGWEEYLEDLTYLTTAAAPLLAPSFQKLKKTLPLVDIIPMYGQTECVRALYYPGTHQLLNGTAWNSCGIPIFDTETCVLVDGELKTEGQGELVVRSPHVMDGYLNKPEETAKTFKDGWLYTGDIFGIDEVGRHFFIGRNDDIVKIKGERCAPIELDNALMLMKDVTEAAAFAVKDGLWGHRFVVYISGKIAKNEVMRYCKKNVEPYLMPKDVVIMKEIPKTDSGKISRQLLKEHYEARQ